MSNTISVQLFVNHLVINNHLISEDFAAKFIIKDYKICNALCHRYSGTFSASWSAEFGYDSQETERTYNKTTKTWEQKSKTVTTWQHASGVAQDKYHEYIYAGSELSYEKMSKILDSSEAFKTGTPLECNNWKYLEDEEGSEESIRGVLYSRLNNDVIRAAKKHANGDRQRSWRYDSPVLHENTTKEFEISIGVITLSHESNIYYIYVQLNNTSNYVLDKLPIESGKRLNSFLSYLPAAIMGLDYLKQLDNNIVHTSLLVAAFGLYGFIRNITLKRRSLKRLNEIVSIRSENGKIINRKKFWLDKMLLVIMIVSAVTLVLSRIQSKPISPSTTQDISENRHIASTIVSVSKPSYKTSFNCKKASNYVENTICSDEELAENDLILNQIYKQQLAISINKNDLKQEQRQWVLKTLNTCTDKSCILNTITSRINFLENINSESSPLTDLH